MFLAQTKRKIIFVPTNIGFETTGILCQNVNQTDLIWVQPYDTPHLVINYDNKLGYHAMASLLIK